MGMASTSKVLATLSSVTTSAQTAIRASTLNMSVAAPSWATPSQEINKASIFFSQEIILSLTRSFKWKATFSII
jgi:hypothetical protein